MLIGYARVSKADGSQSLDLQHDALRAAGVERDNIYDDLASGGRDDRPGLTACLKSLRDGDVLVVWKLDRLGRSLAHLVNTVKELSDRKIGLRVLTGKGAQIDTTTASGRMVFGIFATLAEFERDLIRERTMAGLASASARSQGRTKIRAHQSSGASRASRHGPARYFSFRSLQGTRHRARHSLPICRSQRRAQRPWKACSRTYVATRFFSQVEPPPRFIRKLKEPPLNRTNIFFGESHSDWLPVRGGESGDFVFRRGDGHAFAKIAPASRRGELAGERDRLIWLKGRGVACPEVINWQEEQEGACLVITAIPGVPAADLSGADLLKAWPSMGQQLGAVHSLSVDQCPFERRLSRMFGRAVDVVSRNAVNPDFLPDEDKSTPQLDLLARVERELPVRLDQERTDMVVCHGDPCMPNFMVDPKTLQCTGLIDLGRLGTADRYADLALMIANAEENWAAPDEAERAFAVLFNVLGIEAPDRERLAFYLRLDPLTWG
jgi:streptomycin 3"-kinase